MSESPMIAWNRTAIPALCCLSLLLAGGARGQTSQSAPKLNFDVASIHEWGANQEPAGAYSASLQFSAGRVRGQCTTLRGLLSYAYQLTGSDRVEGMPPWGEGSCGAYSRNTFSIEATMPADTTLAQSRVMVQTLLAERFKLAAHWETKQLPVYALRVIPGKSKLKVSDGEKDSPSGRMGCPPDDHACHTAFLTSSSNMKDLAGVLSLLTTRPVIDRTGLTGSYYFGVLKWAGEESNDSSLPSLFALLREDFGLELKPEVGRVPVLIVDHVQKPAAN